VATYEEAKKIAFNVIQYFETGDRDPYTVVSGNFDGQGISYGPYQHNFGQDTLQPLLREMHEKWSGLLSGTLMTAAKAPGSSSTFETMKNQFLEIIARQPTSKQLDMIQKNWHVPGSSSRLKPEWKVFFTELGRSDPMREVFNRAGEVINTDALKLAKWITDGKVTVRSFTLAKGLVTQNGGIGMGLKLALSAARPFLKVYRGRLKRKGRTVDWAWMTIVAGTRAIQTRILGQKRFMDDVQDRKFLIIDGMDNFRRQKVDLDAKYGLNDDIVEGV